MTRLTGRPDLTITVYHGHKATTTISNRRASESISDEYLYEPNGKNKTGMKNEEKRKRKIERE